MAKFIGRDALQELATKFEKNIVMGAAYFRPDVFDRLKIERLSGQRFKNVASVMWRKGHTTRRKVVGEALNSQIGKLKERTMVCRLSWNHFTDNADNYIEDAVVAMDGTFSYPMSEIAFQACVANYGEDLFDCLWHGDDTIDMDDKTAEGYHYGLYTGFLNYLAQDVTNGDISKTLGNLVTLTAFSAPATTADFGAWTVLSAFRNSWHANLRNAPKVLIYMNQLTAEWCYTAYQNKHGHMKYWETLENGNYKVPEWPNVEICPEDGMGVGYKVIATVPGNFQYGVDSDNAQSYVSVRVGSDIDHKDISFQVQSIQGTRVLDIAPARFCMSDATMTPADIAGDYREGYVIVKANDDAKGTVKIDGVVVTTDQKFVQGTTLTLKAEAASGSTFTKWKTPSGDKTTAEIEIVAPGDNVLYEAVFS